MNEIIRSHSLPSAESPIEALDRRIANIEARLNGRSIGGSTAKSPGLVEVYLGRCIRCKALQTKTICDACWELAPWA